MVRKFKPVVALGALGVFGFGVSACVIVDADSNDHYAVSVNDDLESFRAVSITSDGVRVRADSNGCTGVDSFRIITDEDGGAVTVAFVRAAPDRCKALLSDGVEIDFSRERLGVGPDDRLIVLNPVRG